MCNRKTRYLYVLSLEAWVNLEQRSNHHNDSLLKALATTTQMDVNWV